MTSGAAATAGRFAGDSAQVQAVPDPAPERRSLDLPLCVDLDGTLLRTDVLAESLVGILFSGRPSAILALLGARDRSELKRVATVAVPPDPALLPYNQPLLAFLRAEKARGRFIVLATAADRAAAELVADHLGLFDEVLASDGVTNLKGKAKAAALVRRFGQGGFVYAGNDAADLPPWRAARAAILVDVPRGVAARVRRAGITVEAVFDGRTPLLPAALRAMRPHQWVKNLLVLVPLLTAHDYANPATWAAALTAVLAFCLTASGIYLLNDLADLAADRRHPRKRNRPMASGDLGAGAGLALGLALLALGLAAAASVGTAAVLLPYAVLSVAYSIRLKEVALVDAFLLATLYTLRVVAGGVATGHHASVWLLGFSGFLFLGLALLKRSGEVVAASGTGGLAATASRRGYREEDAPVLLALGTASSFASAVILALYVESATAAARYAAPWLIWGAVPLVLFWQCRLWLATSRGIMTDDPIVYAARDRVSWLTAAAMAALAVEAKVGLLLGPLHPAGIP